MVVLCGGTFGLLTYFGRLEELPADAICRRIAANIPVASPGVTAVFKDGGIDDDFESCEIEVGNVRVGDAPPVTRTLTLMFFQGRRYYAPDAVPESFVAVPGLGDEAAFQRSWGLVIRRGDLVLLLSYPSYRFSDPDPTDEASLRRHAAFGQVIDAAF
ncbi:hypothetical protein GCM10010112_13360 [Actinoplanes lobatus]|uniref:Uncharacterized protein n=1 Tax=Actinoplanes lobatus TaxID=113568 RepID=A0A7W7HMT1_9ACTN|nr:hypothetical protein [Actinoplanes lobatus]MBB4753172.1 hypothetical protein [Actinoplanes lobatus]GGN58984.1 hypothetical protein GCM10010112_13360 [Actinoplanes lobatus]GIE42967.1 hypothetical protein Alo02nite_58650 [Actinoplanes lobatus]